MTISNAYDAPVTLRRGGRVLTFAFMLAAAGAPSIAQETWRVSVDSQGSQAGAASRGPSTSGDGRFVAFYGWAANLVPGDTNGAQDVFVHDRATGATSRVSVASSGLQGNGSSTRCAISADGRFVAFESDASNLVAGDSNGEGDVFVHDRETGMTTRVSRSWSGGQGNESSWYPSISADGRHVAFSSNATNLVPGDTNASTDAFVHDRQSGTTTRVSVSSSGVQGDMYTLGPVISGDGRMVAFSSFASDLVEGDTNWAHDVFVHDTQTGATTRVSVDSSGGQVHGDSYCNSLSHDGRYVAFESPSKTLVPGDTGNHRDVFVHDQQSGATERVSVDSSGGEGNGDSEYGSISADGRFVAFSSYATNLASMDFNFASDVFVHDRATGTTEGVTTPAWQEGTSGGSLAPSISADGLFVSFQSQYPYLVDGDTNGVSDVFLHDRGVQLEMLAAQPAQLSLATGGIQEFFLQAGPQPMASLYLLVGSSSGVAPGVAVDGLLLPLNPDGYTSYSLANANGSVLLNTFGGLLADGAPAAQVALQLPAGLDPGLAGATLHHACLVFDPLASGGAVKAVSNPVSLTLAP